MWPPRRDIISPQQQLWNETSHIEQQQLMLMLRPFKNQYQQDLCYGLVAWLRFGINRPFENPVMQMAYEKCLGIVDHNPRHTHV